MCLLIWTTFDAKIHIDLLKSVIIIFVSLHHCHYYRLILAILFNFDHKFEDTHLNCQPTVHLRIIIENSCTWLIIYVKIIFSHLTNMTSNQWIERPCYWSSQTKILMTTINALDMTSQLQTCCCFAFSTFRYPGFCFPTRWEQWIL